MEEDILLKETRFQYNKISKKNSEKKKTNMLIMIELSNKIKLEKQSLWIQTTTKKNLQLTKNWTKIWNYHKL